MIGIEKIYTNSYERPIESTPVIHNQSDSEKPGEESSTNSRALQGNEETHTKPSQESVTVESQAIIKNLKLFKNVQECHADDTNTINKSLVSISRKTRYNVEVELDLDVFNRIDEIYFDFIKQTSYYGIATPKKRKDKLIAIQIVLRCAFLKKLVLCISPKRKSLVAGCIVHHFRNCEFQIPTALHSLVDCYGRFFDGNLSVRIKDEVCTINNIAADIVRLCANHSTVGARIVEVEKRNHLKSLSIWKVLFLDYMSTRRLQEYARLALEGYYKSCEMAINLTPDTCERYKESTMPKDTAVVSYPRLVIDKNKSVMLLNYRNWLKKLHSKYPHVKQMILLGAVLISDTYWFSDENLNTPVNILVPNLDTKGCEFTPQDILDYFGWKVARTEMGSGFETLLRYGLELCKSQVFNFMLKTQKTSFSQAGNSAQLVTYSDDQKEFICNDNLSMYSDLVPDAKSQMVFKLHENQNTKLSHMFGIAKAVTYTPDHEGGLYYKVQKARWAHLSQDFIAGGMKKQ